MGKKSCVFSLIPYIQNKPFGAQEAALAHFSVSKWLLYRQKKHCAVKCCCAITG